MFFGFWLLGGMGRRSGFGGGLNFGRGGRREVVEQGRRLRGRRRGESVREKYAFDMRVAYKQSCSCQLIEVVLTSIAQLLVSVIFINANMSHLVEASCQGIATYKGLTSCRQGARAGHRKHETMDQKLNLLSLIYVHQHYLC